jgi:Rad3-related DNA helicase
MYGLGNIDLQKYNPFPSFQPGQAEAIQQIISHLENGQKVVELNAPTAAGKSLDLFVLGRILSEQLGVRVVYTTPLVALVNQLENEPAFAAMPVLKGKHNYPCAPLSEALDDRITAEDCPFSSWETAIEKIPVCASCPYRMAYKRFMDSGFGATTLARYQMPGAVRDETVILLVDESAGLEKTLIDRATLKIPDRININNLSENLRVYYHELEKEIEKLTRLADNEDDLAEKVKINKEKNYCERESRKCVKVLAHIEKGHPYIIDRERKFRLLDGRSEFEDMIEGLDFVVLASGTPTTQILTDNYKAVIIQHPIPVERRLCYYMPVGSMNYKERFDTAPKMAQKIHELHAVFGKKTMVHCGAYVVARMLYDKMPNKSICILQDQQDREGSKNKFLNADGEAIFLSVNFEEGLDLKGPNYPLNIIAKLSFENIADEFIKARNERDNYKRYNMNTAVATMQAAGRTTRSINDHSQTFILDTSWQGFYNRNKRLLQPWFIASLQVADQNDMTRLEEVSKKAEEFNKVFETKIETLVQEQEHTKQPEYGQLEKALIYLAGRCDGAIKQDGKGFNGRDTEFGHSLARQIKTGKTLSPKQRSAATRMLGTYKKQLAQGGIIL